MADAAGRPRVERELRPLIGLGVRAYGILEGLFFCALFLGIPAAPLLVAELTDAGLVTALLMGIGCWIGGAIPLAVLVYGVMPVLVRGSAQRIGKRFPSGTPEREVVMKIIRQGKGKSLGMGALYDALGGAARLLSGADDRPADDKVRDAVASIPIETPEDAPSPAAAEAPRAPARRRVPLRPQEYVPPIRPGDPMP